MFTVIKRKEVEAPTLVLVPVSLPVHQAKKENSNRVKKRGTTLAV